ncbi:Putative GNAT domain, acyl-CoA N-acyltransferase, N-acetyltransferase 9 [Septoria linicola]|uniref:GNAT domain, acyl-CoA N-acyltransferase, N-acetyltransferase 9 n=1 Tax=Septoria linicola TaxID=215465 RepID=A0A9Q9B797_9PEZI|nr:putative GNAT domain, acyl-CoA N-acyltransferase, N-acetyltransferase 9 [Septoria linicola]USW57671.1 Putative GNAT domain, acyl-CoA N-acyltransferase, N-acetyltransferase 9 [Septoria linicola]
MKVNEHIAIQTGAILLVPYSKHHVPTYHEWMQDKDLQEATASEPLSIDEEYAMQQSWRNDHDKLTFIVCHPLDSSSSPTEAARTTLARAKIDDAPDRMIGDINLFLFPPDSEEMEEDVAALGGSVVGEVELMIAKKDSQQKGYGRAALLTFLDYILANWSLIGREYARRGEDSEKPQSSSSEDIKPTDSEASGTAPAKDAGDLASTPQLAFLRVKINQANVGSIRLFDSVGFVRTVDEPNYFGELELRWLPDIMILRRQKGWEKSRELAYHEVEDEGFREELDKRA